LFLAAVDQIRPFVRAAAIAAAAAAAAAAESTYSSKTLISQKQRQQLQQHMQPSRSCAWLQQVGQTASSQCQLETA
jgi:hypothetical protein